MFRVRSRLHAAADTAPNPTPAAPAAPPAPAAPAAPATPAPAAPAPAAPAAPTPGSDPGILGDDAKPAKPADPNAPPAKPAAAPEKYEAFKLPEGVALDTAALAKFEPAFRALGLTQEQAQGLVDIQAGLVKERDAQLEAAVVKQTAEWLQSVRTDQEIGGANYDATVAAAKTGMSRVGTPALKKFLTETGLTNHPELVRAFAKIGKLMSEDQFHKPPAGGNGIDKPLEERMYPGQGPRPS